VASGSSAEIQETATAGYAFVRPLPTNEKQSKNLKKKLILHYSFAFLNRLNFQVY